MANIIKGTSAQINDDNSPKRLVVQYYDDVVEEDKVVIINYDDLTTEEKNTYDAFKALAESKMS